jgi:hypothetical protein
MKHLDKYIALAKQHPKIAGGIALALVIIIWAI